MTAIQTGTASLGHNSTRLEDVRLADLKIRESDPRRFKARDVELACAVMRKLPPSAPIPLVINGNGEVLVGQILFEAARKLSCESILVVRHDGLSPSEEKQYAIAITQLLSKGSWDPAALELEISALEELDIDLDHLSLGFDNGELDKLLALPGELTASSEEADALAALGQKPVSRRGTDWRLGNHRVRCGSATDADDFASLMADEEGAMAITDPPYGCKVDGFVSSSGKHRDFVEGAGDKSPDELAHFFKQFACGLRRHLAPGALAFLFIDWRSLPILLRVSEEVFGPLVQFCCWAKDRAGMGSFYRSQHELILVLRAPGGKHRNNVQLGKNGRNRSNVWAYPSAASSRRGREGDLLENHPTPKPVEMIADAILDCTERGDIIVDCFLGSGTALIAAERTKRVCYAMELDPLYVDLAVRRWQEWTGLQAIEEASGLSFDEVAEREEGEEGLIDG